MAEVRSSSIFVNIANDNKLEMEGKPTKVNPKFKSLLKGQLEGSNLDSKDEKLEEVPRLEKKQENLELMSILLSLFEKLGMEKELAKEIEIKGLDNIGLDLENIRTLDFKSILKSNELDLKKVLEEELGLDLGKFEDKVFAGVFKALEEKKSEKIDLDSGGPKNLDGVKALGSHKLAREIRPEAEDEADLRVEKLDLEDKSLTSQISSGEKNQIVNDYVKTDLEIKKHLDVEKLNSSLSDKDSENREKNKVKIEFEEAKVEMGEKIPSSKISKNEERLDLEDEEELEYQVDETREASTKLETSGPKFESKPVTREIFQNKKIQEGLVKQIVNKLEFKLGNETKEVFMELKPEALGKLKMNLEFKNGEITAKLLVDNYKTKEILEVNLNRLNEDLEEAGMKIKSFEVFVGNNSDFHSGEGRNFNFYNGENKKFKNKPGLNKGVAEEYESGSLESNKLERVSLDGGIDLLA